LHAALDADLDVATFGSALLLEVRPDIPGQVLLQTRCAVFVELRVGDDGYALRKLA